MIEQDELVSAEQVAAWWGVSGQAVRLWAREGRVPSVRTPSGQLRFWASQVRPPAGSVPVSDVEEASANGTSGTGSQSHHVIGAQQEPPSERIA